MVRGWGRMSYPTALVTGHQDDMSFQVARDDRQDKAITINTFTLDPIIGNFSMKNSVLVTGASGFIGRHLCRRLRDNGFHVRALMRRPVEGHWDAAVRLELGRQTIPPDLLAGVDCIFHLAGKAHAVAEGAGAEEEYQIANVVSTHDLLRAARAEGVRGFVYFSSVKAMGEEGEASATAAPTSPYGRSKLAAEQAVLNSGSVPHPVVLRPSLVYGPHPKGYLELMIRGVRAGWFPPYRN